ncbi:MAG TPA: hypothetical protein VIN73_02925 [Vicingaceae bacterium]
MNTLIKNNIKNILLLSAIFLVAISSLNAQFYNGTKVGFGKNRVQFDYFEWKFYRYQQYETYFYTGGQELAEYTAKVARKYIPEQEELFEFNLVDKIQFIIYNKQSHFKQSNVGLSLENGELGGITSIMGEKVFLYFNGNHEDFDIQIKEGIARVLINQQVYGSNWRQVIKNSTLLTLPDWYQLGLTSYISKGWDSEIENSVRDGVMSGKYKKFNRLSDKDAIVAGHSLWAYITATYGEAVIPNILYMTRVTQSVDKGFLYVLGVSTKSLTKEWLEFYKSEFKNLDPPPKEFYEKNELFKIKKKRDYSQFKVSNDGNNFAYVTNKLGQYKIYIYYKDNDKKYKIFKKEFKLDRVNDYSYPVLAWHPASEILSFVTEEKGFLKMYYFDINSGGLEVKALFNLEKVTAMDYHDNGREMVFSGVYKGQSDLYLYNIGANSHKKITNDLFDDLEPQFIENSTKIIFTSNRLTDSLGYQPANLELFYNKRDVWILDYLSEDKTLSRVTESTRFSESLPYGYDSAVYYLGEQDRINTQFSAVKDSFITHIDTAIHYHHFYDAKPAKTIFSRGIKEHFINSRGVSTTVLVDNFKYHLLVNDINEPILDSVNQQQQQDLLQNEQLPTNLPDRSNSILLKPVEYSSEVININQEEVDITNYVFDSEKTTPIQKNTIVIGDRKSEIDSLPEEFKMPNQRNYNLSFFNDNSALRLSNNFVNGEYQLFTGGAFNGPGIGGLIKLGTVDLFEDHKIYGGVRISSGTREYFMTYQNLVKRWDKEYTFSRTTFSATNGFNVFGVATNTLHYSLKYPFSEVASIRGTASVRNDNIVVKSTDQFALEANNLNEFRGVIKMAYVFDNSRHKMPNIYFGTKFKLFGEYYQEVFENNTTGDGTIGNTQVLGLDFRHSLQLSREIVWVNRLASSASFGNEKLIYYMGSVDEWIPLGGQNRFINQEDIDFTKNYRYQALAANLRGFPQNIRRGSNFAVINSELRVPVFKYFIRRPIRSKFIENFQLITFADVGSAWDGVNPWDKENRINKDVIVDGPLKVTVFKNIDPIVAGYGFGMRTTLLGYFVRADWAWGVENGVSNKKPIFYLSLSLDI